MEMTRCVGARQMRDAEERAFSSEAGLTAEILMGRAGRALADALREHIPARSRIAVLCGKGNNGGDGYAAASFLSPDYECLVWSFGAADSLSPASSVYHSLCARRGLLVAELPDLEACGCIIDCLTGIGFSGSPRAELAELIAKINRSAAWTVSADIPSGLPADGEVDASAAIVRADCTVTFGFPKRSCVLYPGRSFAGRLIVADIGLPSIPDSSGSGDDVFVVDENSHIALAIAPPAWDAHKYRNGHCAIVGGFTGMEGASLMAADAALETGVGLCSIFTNDDARPVIAGRIPEAMTSALKGSSDSIRQTLLEYFLQKKVNTLLLGPGLGRGDFSRLVFGAALEAAAGTVAAILLDGDALWFLAGAGSCDVKGSALVLTPHAGEASKLMGVDAAGISRDPYAAALRLSETYGCTAVMKGPSTVVAGKGRFINMSGNSSLAAAGSGDVLAGICAALLSRGLAPDHAAAAAVYIHGRAADNLVRRRAVHIIRATDIIRELRTASEGIFLKLD